MNTTYDFSNMVVTTADLRNFRKHKNFHKAVHLVGVVEGQIKDLAQVRFYGTGKTTTAILWINSPILGLYGSEVGKVGGRYTRDDAAFQNAILGMGIKGTGYHTAENFFEALAKHLGVSVYSIVESHG